MIGYLIGLSISQSLPSVVSLSNFDSAFSLCYDVREIFYELT